MKAAFLKANTAEQEESRKNYKAAFELYKEAVEILMPVAERECDTLRHFLL